ncbi:zinc finger SWIM domain-containing protein 7-like [Mya arenaria]|nr:zinc finger SWIM domain-containing protein 7-like [Mya arenaria]XP_052798292.1 zinc finger SWIM domain-containing protein 7-like [Mya arenaria]
MLNDDCQDPKGAVVEAVVDELLEEVGRTYKDNGKIPDEVLSALNNVFQSSLLPALELVDSHNVTKVTCPAGRALYQVIGSSGTPYTCFLSSRYCSCPSYQFSCLKKGDHLMCKHVLAVRLCEAMGGVRELDVTNQEITNMLKQLE